MICTSQTCTGGFGGKHRFSQYAMEGEIQAIGEFCLTDDDEEEARQVMRAVPY